MADGESPEPPPIHEDGIKQPRPHADLPKSYSQVVQGDFAKGPNIVKLSQQSDSDSIPFKPIATFNGKPSVSFTILEKENLLEKMKFVLVGKFSHGRPPLNIIKDFFMGLKLQGAYNISLFDHKHLFLEFASKVNYSRVWMKLNWSIKGFSMRVFKWECGFSPQKESAIAPVWIRLEGVPLYMFDEASLLSIANAIGKPLRVHPSNLNREKLNSAKVCVELNVVEPRPDAIWVSFEDHFSKKPVDGFWVHVYYDAIPSFCTECLHMGHRLDWCKRRTTSMNTMWKVLDNMSQPALTVFDGLANLQGATSGTGPSKIENTWQVHKAGSGRGGVSVLGETIVQKMSRRGDSTYCADCVVGQDCAITNVVQIVQLSNDSVEPARPIDRPAELVTAAETAGQLVEQDGATEEEQYEGGNVADFQGPQQGAQVFEGTCCSTVAAGNEGQLLKHDGTTSVTLMPPAAPDEEQTVGAVIVEQIVGPSTAQVTEKSADIHGGISSVGFSTPKKGSNFTKVSTPSSWADQVEEEKRQEKERSTTIQGIPSAAIEKEDQVARDVTDQNRSMSLLDVSMEIHKLIEQAAQVTTETPRGEERDRQLNSQELVITGANNSAMESQIAADPQKGVTQTIKKVPTKTFHTDLPIDFDPMMCNKADATEEITWSKLISGSIKLVARRSVSPVGRSSEKLKKLRKRVDYLDHDAGKAILLDKEQYLEENEEFFKAVYHRPQRGRDYHHRPQSERERGRGRGQGRGFGRGYGPGRFMGRGRTRDGREGTIIY